MQKFRPRACVLHARRAPACACVHASCVGVPTATVRVSTATVEIVVSSSNLWSWAWASSERKWAGMTESGCAKQAIIQPTAGLLKK
jgi:hypothetical protein